MVQIKALPLSPPVTTDPSLGVLTTEYGENNLINSKMI